MGRDWCLLAAKLGFADDVPKAEDGRSQTETCLAEWEAADANNTIGKLITALESIGRPDAAGALVSGCPFYRITSLEDGFRA